MNYDMKIYVHFDPCSLREHDFIPYDFGLATLTKLEVCSRCGAGRYPRFDYNGINLNASSIWGNA